MSQFEVCVVGGGIGGLYCAYKLSKTKRVVLFDDRTYIGGRIQTHEMGYEIGAARFNNNHKILLKLIRKFKLTPVKLPTRIDFIKQSNSEVQHTPNIEKHYGSLLDHIIENTKVSSELRKITFFQHAINILGSKREAQSLVDMFGYYSEIKEMNAYDAYVTFKTDFGNIQYYVLKEGLSELCLKMTNEILKNGGKVYLRNAVTNVERTSKGFYVRTISKSITTDRVVFALKPYQLRQFKILENIHTLTKSVYEAPLIRIYAQYPKPLWFDDVYRSTTNNKLRQIIPINKEKGLIMVSYTDGKDTAPFMERGKLRPKTQLKKIVKENLRALFQDKDIPEPLYFNAHLWTVGCHHFFPKNNSDLIRKKVVNPSPNVYVCGEGFSSKQAWMEGALETADEVVSKILK